MPASVGVVFYTAQQLYYYTKPDSTYQTSSSHFSLCEVTGVCEETNS